MNNTSNEGTSRKRRNRTTSERTPHKRSRRSADKSKKPAKVENRVPTKGKKKKRSRRRKTGMREKICSIFEKALTDSPSLPPIYHLFNSVDSSGTPRASLIEMLRTLEVSKSVKNIHFLSHSAWKAMSNLTYLFAIEEDEPGSLFLKYRPIYDSKKCTVYVDNLPEGCKKEKLKRLAVCYGNVADVKISHKGPRIVQPTNAKKPIDVGSREKSFGFVRFVDEDSANKMVKNFRLNDPSLNCINGVRGHPFCDLYAMKLLREIRLLRHRRRRRTLAQTLRLMRLRAKLEALRTLNMACRKTKHRGSRRNTWKRNFQNNHRDSKYLPDPTPSASNQPAPPVVAVPCPSPPPPPSPAKPSTSRSRNSRKKQAKKNGGPPPKKDAAASKKKKTKKKRRKLKYTSRKAPDYIPGRSIQQYFERVQVLPMKRYEELKEEYLQLVAKQKSKNGINQ